MSSSSRGKVRRVAWRWKRWAVFAGGIGCAVIVGLLAAGPLFLGEGTSRRRTPPVEQSKSNRAAAAVRSRQARSRRDPPGRPAVEPLEPTAATPQATIEALRKEALEVAERLIRRYPQSADAAALMGTVNDRHGMTVEATKHWQRALELDPNRVDVHDALGSVALERGDAEQAVARWTMAVELAPGAADIHQRLAQGLVSCGRTKEAVVALRHQIELTPRVAETQFQLAQAHLQLQEYEQAEEHYRAAIEIQPDHAGAHYGLCVTCARTGRPDQSRQYREKFNDLKDRTRKIAVDRRSGFDLATAARRNLVKTYTDAGRLYQMHGDVLQAEQLWLQAAALDPQGWICRQELAGLYLAGGLNRKALAVCEQLTAIDSEHAACYLNTGVLLARLRRFDAAEKALRKGIELAPQAAAGYVSLVRVLMATDRKLPEAKTSVQRLVQLHPTAEHYCLLGEVCHRSGDAPGAVAALEKASQLDPDSDAIRAAHQRMRKR